MALSRPTFKVNIAANKKSCEKQSIFYDLKPDTTTLCRILPPTNEDGLLFTLVANHFKLTAPEGNGMALSCLEQHGNPDIGESCYLCNLVEILKRGDKEEQAIADAIYVAKRWYIQALVFDKANNEYIGPKLIGLSRTTADAVQNILVTQDDLDQDYFCDPDKGQSLSIRRNGSGIKTRYVVSVTGKQESLDDIFPGWEGKILEDPESKMDLKVYDVNEQKKVLLRTFGDKLDWDSIQAKIG